MRHGLRSQQGMAQVDAQQTYAVWHDYLMKQERRESAMKRLEGPKLKKMRASVKHEDTKIEVQQLSQQLVQCVKLWAEKAQRLLSHSGHGIPSVSEI